MAKKKAAKAADGEKTLQAVCDEILGKEGVLTGSALFEKVKAVRPEAKPASVGQCLNKYKKKHGLIKTRTTTKAKPGRKVVASGGSIIRNGLVDTLRRVTELAAIIDIPQEKLADVVRVLSR
jgi:hypothetical protein